MTNNLQYYNKYIYRSAGFCLAEESVTYNMRPDSYGTSGTKPQQAILETKINRTLDSILTKTYKYFLATKLIQLIMNTVYY